MEPEDEWAHRLRASALLALERLEEAVEAAREAVRLAPEGWSGHLLLGVASACVPGGGRAARAAFGRATQLAPAEAEIPYVQGRLRHSQGATWSARRAYRRALRLDPQHPGALEGLAAVSFAGGRLAESLRYVRAASAAAPGRIATAEYLDRSLLGALGWAVVTAWWLLVVLVFTVFPVAWAVAALLVLAYVLWARRVARALPSSGLRLAWGRVRRQPRMLVRLIVAAATLPVALAIGVIAAGVDPNRFPGLQLALAAGVTFGVGMLAMLAVDGISALRRRRPAAAGAQIETALDAPAVTNAYARRLVFLWFSIWLLPAAVLFVPAVDPEPTRGLRAGLGTVLIAGAGLLTWWVRRRQRRLPAPKVAWWRRVPAVALPAFAGGWLTLVAFSLGAAYLPDRSPLLVDRLAVGGFVMIGFGVPLLVVVLVVRAARGTWRLVRYSMSGRR